VAKPGHPDSYSIDQPSFVFMNTRSEAILEFLSHEFWMTPSLIHANMASVTWSYNTTLNRLSDLEDRGLVDTHHDRDGWYKINEDGKAAIS
jgi:DNA-binding PadR family transcriptional regulator